MAQSDERVIKFVHTADTHIGVELYGRIDRESGINTRVIDFTRAFSRSVDFAIEKKADLFLFAGDAYKTATPAPLHESLFAEQIGRLDRAGIETILVVGNHDTSGSVGRVSALEILARVGMRHVHVFSRPGNLVLDTEGGRVGIVAIPWPSRAALTAREEYRELDQGELSRVMAEKLALVVRKNVEKITEEIPVIVVSHAMVRGAKIAGSERATDALHDPVVSVSDFLLPKVRYVALGHVHKPQILFRDERRAVVYSGSPERIDFGEAEDRKVFVYGELEEKTLKLSSVETGARKMVNLGLDFSGEELSDLTPELMRRISKVCDGAIVKVSVKKRNNQIIHYSRISKELSKRAAYLSVVEVLEEKVAEVAETRTTAEKLSIEDAIERAARKFQNFAPKSLPLQKLIAEAKGRAARVDARLSAGGEIPETEVELKNETLS